MNGMLYGQKTGEEYIFFLYDENGNVYGFVVKNSNSQSYYYYEFNLQGDIMGIIDSSGTRVVEYTYGAWGDILSITGTMSDTIGQKNPLRYRGYYYDAETGFYYLQSRYYDAEICRFLNADNVITGTGEKVQGYNLYVYCFNNPVNMSDSEGNWPKIIKKIGSRIKNTANIIEKIVTSPFKVIKVSVGMGVGIGGKVETTVNNVPIEVGISTSTTDSISYNKGKIDIKNSTSKNFGFNFANLIDISYGEGKEHSYMNSNCTCNFLHSTYGQKQQCRANKKTTSSDMTLGFSIGAYLFMGGEISVGIDLNAWGEELISIFDESISYED